MKCPVCHKDTKVIDSRSSDGDYATRRRRECLKCSFRFSTLEEPEILDLVVVKRDGRREMYSQEKMQKGLRRSLEKRSITDEKFKKLVSAIERDIQAKRKNQLTSKELGAIVMRHLKKTDPVAYIRFASVYESFQDAKAFQQELNKLIRKRKTNSK